MKSVSSSFKLLLLLLCWRSWRVDGWNKSRDSSQPRIAPIAPKHLLCIIFKFTEKKKKKRDDGVYISTTSWALLKHIFFFFFFFAFVLCVSYRLAFLFIIVLAYRNVGDETSVFILTSAKCIHQLCYFFCWCSLKSLFKLFSHSKSMWKISPSTASSRHFVSHKKCFSSSHPDTNPVDRSNIYCTCFSIQKNK